MELLTFDFRNDFIVGDHINKETLHKYSKAPYKLKAALFLLCVEGTAEISINLTKYSIKAYDLITLVPSNFIQIHKTSNNLQLYFAAFSGDFMKQINFIKSSMNFISMVAGHPVLSLKEPIAHLYLEGYNLLIHAQTLAPNRSLDNKNLIIAYLTIFIQATSQLYQNHRRWDDDELSRNNEIYRKFIQLAVEYYNIEHSVSFYAGRLNLTLPHFCTSIKKESGHTPHEILTSILVLDAKAQLRSSDRTIKEIAFSLGFSNLPFFNKFFKKHSGMTPCDYRRQVTGSHI